MVINFFGGGSLVYFLKFFSFKNGPDYLTRRIDQVFIPLIKFLLESFVFDNLARLKYFFRIFSLICVCLEYSQVLVIFLFSKLSDSLLIWFFGYFSFSPFHYEHGTLFSAKFHSYILAVYSYCFIRGSNSFPFFVNYLMSSMYMS